MQGKSYCPFYDLKEAQSQILVILLQIRSTLSTWVEMKIKLVLHVSPLLITPHYKAQGLFLITLDVKPAVLCMRGTNESSFPAIWGPALLHFSIPNPGVEPLHCHSLLWFHQSANAPQVLHPPSKQGQLLLLSLGTTVPSFIINPTTHSLRITENISNLEKSSLKKKVSVWLLRSSKVFLRKNCKYWVLKFLSSETTIDIILVLFSGNFYKTFKCVKIFLWHFVNLQWRILAK